MVGVVLIASTAAPTMSCQNAKSAGKGTCWEAATFLLTAFCCMLHLVLSTLKSLCASADPILAYSAGAEVNQLQWSNTQPDWVAICFSDKTQILRV